MPGKRIDTFEQLIAWQKARNLAREIDKMTKEPPFARDFALAGQLQRSAVSVMANIAEGFERNRLVGVGEGLKTVMLDDRAEASFNRAFYRISAQRLLRRSEEVQVDVDRGFHVWPSSFHIAIL